MRTALPHLTVPLRQPAACRLLTRPLSSSGKHSVPIPSTQHGGLAQAKANPGAVKSRDASSSDAPVRPREADGASESGTPPVGTAAAGGGGGLMGGRAAGVGQHHDYADLDRGEAGDTGGAGNQGKRGGAWKALMLLPIPFGVGLWWSATQKERGRKGVIKRMEQTKVGGMGGRERVVDGKTKGEKIPPKGKQRIDEVIALE